MLTLTPKPGGKGGTTTFGRAEVERRLRSLSTLMGICLNIGTLCGTLYTNLPSLRNGRFMGDSQPNDRGNLSVEEQGNERGPLGVPFAPFGPAHMTPSPAFIKDNIEVLRTMVKERDQEDKARATPKKLTYRESKGGGYESSQTRRSSGRKEIHSSDGSFETIWS
ncbi:hypothetical protein Tco_1466684 [Tanacetum coccineum]